jgi:hypothetical protein
MRDRRKLRFYCYRFAACGCSMKRRTTEGLYGVPIALRRKSRSV